MAVSLKKGQKVSLTKEKPGLSKICIGLGWDEVKPKGFFASILGNGQDIDCDASVYVLKKGKLENENDIISFGNKNHPSGAIYHHGDNLTGNGEGDDEQISINLTNIPSDYNSIVVAVNIYKGSERKQHFGMIENAFIRVVDESNNSEICRYNLTDNYAGKTGVIFGEVCREDGEWKFHAIGEGIEASYIGDIAERFQ